MKLILLLVVMAALVVSIGVLLRPVHAQGIMWPGPPMPPTNINFSTSGNHTIVAAPTAGGACIYGLQLVNAGASSTTINIYLDGGTTAVWSVFLASGGGSANWVLNTANMHSPYFITNSATGFVINSSAAVQINGGVYASTCP